MITRIGNKDNDVQEALAELIDTRAKMVFNLMYAERCCNPPIIVHNIKDGDLYPIVKCDKCGHWINKK